MVVHTNCLNEEFVLQLVLLHLGQLRELVYYFGIIFQPTGANYFSCFSISFCLGDLVVLISHMHVPGSVGCIYFATSVETWEGLRQLFGASPHMLLPLTAVWTVRNRTAQGRMIVVDVLKQIIYKLVFGGFTVFA